MQKTEQHEILFGPCGKRRTSSIPSSPDATSRVRRILRGATALLATLLLGGMVVTASHAATTTVRPDDMLATPAAGGWWFAEDSPSSGNATGSLVQGPGVPPSAVGSARMVLDGGAAGRMLLGTVDYNGTRLDQLTALAYSAYRASADAGNLLAISLQINIDYDLTDASTGWQGRLVFEPYFTVGSGTILEDTWYSYDPLDGGAKWYQSSNAVKADVNVGNPCPQSAPCTLSAIKALYPNAGIHVTAGAVQFKAGAPWPNFDGNVDQFTIGVLGNSTTYDFEAAKVCAATRYVDPAGSNAGNDCDDSGSPCLTIQYAVDQACNGETVNVAAGTYVEQVTIGQSVTLSGAGAASTILEAPAAASRVLTSANYGSGDRNYDYQVGVFGRNIDLAVAPDTTPDETDPRVNAGDAPAGFGPDSWQGPATGKSNWHARYLLDGDYLSALFPADAATLTLSDIASISYYTKRPTGTPAGRDWWIQIYTRPTGPGTGDASSWYHDRFISNYNDHTELDAWTRYSTDSGMTFNLQTPVGPEQTLAQIIAAEGSQLVEMISVQTDSGWGGFDGYVDGLVITLTNGKVGRVSFDATSVAPQPDTVNISGFTLDGNLDAKATGPGTFRAAQLAFLNASGAITDNELVDWQQPSNFGAQGVLSLLLGSAPPASASVQGNTVSGYQKAGIVAFGPGTMEVAISDNVITGAGPTAGTAQNGIQVSDGVGATVERNTVTGNEYTGATWGASGILVFADDALISGNDLAGNQVDLYVVADGNMIEGNNIPAAQGWPVVVMGSGNTLDKNYVNGASVVAIYNAGINSTFTCNRLTGNENGIVFAAGGTPNAANDNAVYGNVVGMDASAVTTIPPVDAQDNYWGCPTGANSAGCDTAVGNLDWTPSASVEPACVTCAGAGGDSDDDGVCDPADNCPLVANAGQENADSDGAGDACDACPNDALDDADGDTVCGDVDNCPADANADQADLDNDGIGDVCDTMDSPGTLLLSQLRLVAADPDSGRVGNARINAIVVDSLAGSSLTDDLLLGNVYLEVEAGLFAATMPLGTCESSGRRIRCRNDVDLVRASFGQLVQGTNDVPGSWKVRIRQSRVANTATPSAPATVSLVQPTPSITRADDISACVVKSQRLTCRE